MSVAYKEIKNMCIKEINVKGKRKMILKECYERKELLKKIC